MSDQIPLVLAHELAPALTQQEARLVEDWCEMNRVWIERGASQALVPTDKVRALLQLALRLGRVVSDDFVARTTQVTIPEIEALRGRT